MQDEPRYFVSLDYSLTVCKMVGCGLCKAFQDSQTVCSIKEQIFIGISMQAT